MGQQLTGVHVFEKLGSIEWEDELIAIQAISALTWKKHHGRIELYCNEEHLESLKKWGVDKIYDKIDVDLLNSSPKNIDKKEYWTFCKLFISSRLEPPFVLVDTDLWINDELYFDDTKSFVAYHEESYDWSEPFNFYVNYDNFVPEKYINYFDNTINPVNVALLFWNDKKLIDDWYNIAYEILNENRNCELSKSQKTIFLEQWMLPMNAVKTNKPYGLLIPQVYNSSFATDPFHPKLWNPPVIEWDKNHYYNFNKIKHVWGLKKSFGYGNILQEVFETLYLTTKEYDLDKFGLSDVLELIEKTSGIILPTKKFNKDRIKVMLFTPQIITNNQTNILLKRIQYLYNTNFDVEFFVTNFNGEDKNNQSLINKIINIIGSKNFITIDKNIESILKVINKNNIDICQYELSNYDVLFNDLMSLIFNNQNLKVIKSKDGINLFSNVNEHLKIDYPLPNNVLPFIPNIGYDFNKNEIPIHEKIKTCLLYSLDYTHKHVICFVDDIFNIPKNLQKIINSFQYNNNVEFHFFDYLNHEDEESKKVIMKLPTYCKLWLESVDYNDFILMSDLVLDFTTHTNSLPYEFITYGKSILKTSPKILNNDFENVLSDNVGVMINQVKTTLFNNYNHEIKSYNEDFSSKYYDFYITIKNM